MKIWFDACHSYHYDDGPKMGIDWYKHYHKYPYKGFTITIFFLKWMVICNIVDNYSKYVETMEKRRRVRK